MTFANTVIPACMSTCAIVLSIRQEVTKYWKRTRVFAQTASPPHASTTQVACPTSKVTLGKRQKILINITNQFFLYTEFSSRQLTTLRLETRIHRLFAT